MGVFKQTPPHAHMQTDTETEAQDVTPADSDAAASQYLALPGSDLAETAGMLTPAEQAFAEHWLQNRNQIKAYTHAYPSAGITKAKYCAPALFREPRVQREIRRIYERWIDMAAVDMARIEREVNRIAVSDMRQIVDPKTGEIIPPNQWDADTAAAVASFKEVEDTRTRKITRTVRMVDKVSSLRLALEMRGALRDVGKEKDKAPRASFHFHIDGLPARNVTGSVTVTHETDSDGARPGPGAPALAKARGTRRARALLDHPTEPAQPRPRLTGKPKTQPRRPSKAPRVAPSPPAAQAGDVGTPQDVSKSRQSAGSGKVPLFGVE